MKTHHVKVHPAPFVALVVGDKTHEFRKNDRDYQTGDTLILQEWDPAKSEYTGHNLDFQITYVSRGPDWGIPDGYAVLSVRPLNRPCLECGGQVVQIVCGDCYDRALQNAAAPASEMA